MKALVVDDSEESRSFLEALLKGNGLTVEMASDGAEALQRLKDVEVDLIMSDVLMPVMDGFELCRRVRADRNLRQIPFMVCTATYTGPQDESLALKIGADRFVQMPCEPDVLMKAVRDVMSGVGRVGMNREPAPPEEEILKLYNERLVRKLEQKMLQAEDEVRARKEAEETLRASEQRYRLLAENTLDVIWTTDMELVFTYVNPAIQRLTGYSPEEWIGSRLQDHCDRETFTKLTQLMEEVVAIGPSGPGVILETSLLKRNREPFTVEISGRVVFDDGGQPIGLQGVSRDISERKRMEERQRHLESQLQQARKLESLGRLAGGVAHDYNNMLSVILGYTELALEGVSEDDQLRPSLQEVLNAARRSADVTRQLLAFARGQAAEPKVIDLSETITNMNKMLRRLIGEDVDLSWSPASDLWSIKMDPAQLDQIMVNLCVNARDAIPGVGKITIESSNATIDESVCSDRQGFLPGEFAKITVADNGCGMDRETLDRLFEPFFTTKEVGRGTGLGLASVYGIVKQNNGFIDVRSEVGKGTTFDVYLPRCADCVGEESKEAATDTLKGHGELVLVVEDESAILGMVRRMLENLGYRVLTAALPDQSIELAEEYDGAVDLLITDMVMPGMNGRDLFGRLKAPNPKLGCLFMSGYTADVIARMGALDKNVFFIQKPFSNRDLAVKVRQALDRR